VIRSIVVGPPTLGAAVGTVWQEFARSRGKRRWGEKRPAYWRDLDIVLRLFPDAQVVHLVRDGRACVASLKHMHWWPSGVTGAMTTWALADRELRRAGRRLPADSYHRLSYESLVREPEAELRQLCAFLDEPFDAAMLQHQDAARDIVPTRKQWHARTGENVATDRIDTWRTELTAAELGLIEAVCGRALRANGYPLSGAGTPPSIRARAGYYLAYARARGSIAKDRSTDWRQRRGEDQSLAAR
jgi:Sulfotransferase family